LRLIDSFRRSELNRTSVVNVASVQGTVPGDVPRECSAQHNNKTNITRSLTDKEISIYIFMKIIIIIIIMVLFTPESTADALIKDSPSGQHKRY